MLGSETEYSNSRWGYNLSARGLKVALYLSTSNVPDEDSEYWFRDFPGDVDPLEIAQVSVGEAKRDINGEIYRSGSLPVYDVRLSLIPGSSADRLAFLYVVGQEFRADDEMDSLLLRTDDDLLWHLDARYPRTGKSVELRYGYFVGMTPGFSATADGRLATHVYTFKFRDCRWG